MDRIITIIIALYIFKKFYEAFSRDQRGKRGGTPHPPLPGQRPSPPTTVKDQAGHSHPAVPKGRPDIRQVLTEFKKALELEDANLGLEGIPRLKATPIKTGREKIRAQEEGVSDQKGKPQGTHGRESLPPDESKMVSEDKREMTDMIHLDEPEILLQGIILAEVLRPPLSRRTHLMPPYLRG